MQVKKINREAFKRHVNLTIGLGFLGLGLIEYLPVKENLLINHYFCLTYKTSVKQS